MISNQTMWALVSLVVFATISISLGTINSHSQQETSKKQENKGYEDLSKYAVVDYDAPEAANLVEREDRNLKNKRYDKQYLVDKNPHPETGGVSRIDEINPPPVIPAVESDLIVIGEIVNANAHLSNDKSGIYTEFTVRVDEILKNDASRKVNQGDFIAADRAGGFVRYPNGQKVLYRISQRDLPRIGNRYVLFLTRDKQNPNYEILTGYELNDNSFSPLDTKRHADDFKPTGKLDFIKSIRNKISESGKQSKN